MLEGQCWSQGARIGSEERAEGFNESGGPGWGSGSEYHDQNLKSLIFKTFGNDILNALFIFRNNSNKQN